MDITDGLFNNILEHFLITIMSSTVVQHFLYMVMSSAIAPQLLFLSYIKYVTFKNIFSGVHNTRKTQENL